MRVVFFIVFCLGLSQASFCASGREAIIARGGWIKVILQRSASTLTVQVPSGFKIIGRAGTLHQSATAGTVQLTSSKNTISASVGGKTVSSDGALVVEPNKPAYVGYFQTPSGKYRGRLLLNARGGSMQVINQIQVDDWLKGVLPAEIGESHIEALKAQAVAARSEAVYKLAKPPHASEGYDFCTGVHCQAYKGMKDEGASYVRACDETLGVVLIVNGEVLDGVYSNVCGGVTAAVEDVWDSKPKPGMTSVLDRSERTQTPDLSSDAALARFLAQPADTTFCNAAHTGYPNYAKKYWRWQKSHTGESLRKAAGVGRVKDVVVSERRRSGRVRKLTITGDSGSRTIVKELPIRNALDLWSGLFYIDVKKSGGYVESATFIGGGNGHGVGLCQMGARIMAATGITFDRILSHYFTGARIQKIYRP